MHIAGNVVRKSELLELCKINCNLPCFCENTYSETEIKEQLLKIKQNLVKVSLVSSVIMRIDNDIHAKNCSNYINTRQWNKALSELCECIYAWIKQTGDILYVKEYVTLMLLINNFLDKLSAEK